MASTRGARVCHHLPQGYQLDRDTQVGVCAPKTFLRKLINNTDIKLVPC